MTDFRQATEQEIRRHAACLEGRKLRDCYGEPRDLPRGKGAFGQLVEMLHFGYSPNSESAPDFPKAGLELKATGVVRASGRAWRAKERLVLSIIDYHGIVDEEDYVDSAFFRKNGRLLLVVYVWKKDASPLDYRVLVVDVVAIDALDAKERAIIESDWAKIRDAVRAGRAHDLSEGDTFYLAACRKGAGKGRDDRSQPCSSVPAKQRAYSLKSSFVTRLVHRMLADAAARRAAQDEQPIVDDPGLFAKKTLEDIVLERLNRFQGQSVDRIAAAVAPDLNRSAKGFYADLARRMLGITKRRIEEFEKADVVMKVVRVQRNGRPRESLSFPAFRYRELAKSTWRTSDLRDTLSKRFLFVFFQEVDGELRLSHAAFWAMPATVLDGEVRRVWLETVRRIRHGQADDLPGSSFSPVAHVRPHGRNARDTDTTPDGKHLVKKSFWLNARYVGQIFASTSLAKQRWARAT